MRINPYTGAPLPEFEHTDALAQIVRLRETQANWKRKPVEERCAPLLQALDYVETERDAGAADISQEMGRPPDTSTR